MNQQALQMQVQMHQMMTLQQGPPLPPPPPGFPVFRPPPSVAPPNVNNMNALQRANDNSG